MQKSDTRAKINGLLEEPALVRLLPEQVSQRWNKYAEVISLSLPPNVVRSVGAMVNVLKAIMKDELVCWVYVSGGEMKAVITTKVYVDNTSGTRDLMIYSFTSLSNNVKIEDWEFMIEKIKNHARSNRCSGVLAYTVNKKVANFLESRGANTDNILIQMEL